MYHNAEICPFFRVLYHIKPEKAIANLVYCNTKKCCKNGLVNHFVQTLRKNKKME